MVLCETARVLGCHESRNPRTFWIPRLCADGITWETDPRHAELIRKSFGVTGRPVTTPGVRDKLTDIEGEVPIVKEASDRYRANTLRAQYLSSDRPDIQMECRDLARKMQQQSNLDEMGLKRLARFLGMRPRLWFGCSSGRSVLHESNPGVIQTMQVVSELGMCVDAGWQYRQHVLQENLVFLWVQAMVTEGKISLGQEAYR